MGYWGVAHRFDNRLSRLELAGSLGVLDDAKSQPIFYRAEWVESFDLNVEIDAGRRQRADLDDGRISHALENVLKFASHRISSSLDIYIATVRPQPRHARVL